MLPVELHLSHDTTNCSAPVPWRLVSVRADGTSCARKKFAVIAITVTGQVYIFEYRDGDGDGDGDRQIPPCTMPNFDAAREEALRAAIDLLPDLQPGKDELSGWLVRVRDESGELLCAVDVAEAEAHRSENP